MKNKTENKPATALSIVYVRRTRKHVVIHYRNGEEDHQLKSRDNPLPAFDRAIAALAPVVLEVLHLPAPYGNENFKATGLTISDAGGNEQVTIVAQKQLPECNGPFNLCTPLRLLDEPVKEGAVGKPLNDVQADVVHEVIEQAKAYVRGERAQGQIPLEDVEDTGDGEEHEDAEEGENARTQDDKTAELPLAAPEMAHNKPKRGRPRKEAAAAGR